VSRTPEGRRKPPEGGASGRAADGGLSNTNKVKIQPRFLKRPLGNTGFAVNRTNGKFVVIDPSFSRLSRLQRRILQGFVPAAEMGFPWEVVKGQKKARKAPKWYMITLTYSRAEDWQPKQITETLQTLMRRMQYHLLAYAWVAEIQAERLQNTGEAAVHYHVIIRATKSPRFMDRCEGRRKKAWKWGCSKVEPCHHGKGARYLSKYASKEAQKDYQYLPRGARAYGVWVNKSLGFLVRNMLRFTAIPSWLRAGVDEVYGTTLPTEHGYTIKRAEGGGWFVGDTHYASPWKYYPDCENVEKLRRQTYKDGIELTTDIRQTVPN
jgi:hypothetical protein